VARGRASQARHLFPDELDRLAETLEATHRAARPVTGVEKESATG
jgi:hypothetical protein